MDTSCFLPVTTKNHILKIPVINVKILFMPSNAMLIQIFGMRLCGSMLVCYTYFFNVCCRLNCETLRLKFKLSGRNLKNKCVKVKPEGLKDSTQEGATANVQILVMQGLGYI